MAALLGLLTAVPAPAQTVSVPEGSEPGWREADTWQQPQGLPQDTVFTILQTGDGYLWLGTRGGLVRFDGVRFTTFDDRSKDQLQDNEVWALLEGTDSTLWIGTYGGGLTRLKDGRFTVLTTTNGLVNDFVRQLARDAAGTVWIGTDRGLSSYRDGRFTNFTVTDGLSHPGIRSLHADRDGAIWIATKNGIHTVADGRIQAANLPEPRPTGVVEAVLRDRLGALWVGTQDGLFRSADGRTTRYTTADGLSSNRVRCLTEDSRGRLWIATNVGLDRYTGAPAPARPIQNAAPLSDIRSLGVDREGSLWLGYEGRGLSRFHQGLFLSYTAENGLPSSDVRTMLEDTRGTRWIGTAKGLSALRAGTVAVFGVAEGVPAVPIDSLAEDREGHLWVGTEAGLYRSQDSSPCTPARCAPRFEPVRNEAIPAMHARVLFQDRQGALWAGTDAEGLARYRDGRFTTFTVKDGLASDSVRAIVEDRDGHLWIGSKGGIQRLKDGNFVSYTKKDGLADDGVSALYWDDQETLWIATRHGVSRFKDGRFTSYTTRNGLYSSHVYGFVEDDAGALWMSCAKGIFQVRMKQLTDFAEGKIPAVTSVAYGREHGLPSTMATVATHPVGARSRDGRVWFTTRGGLTVVDPHALSTNRIAPPVHLEQVSVDERAFDVARVAEVPPGRGDIVFRYTAPSFIAPEKVRFKYRLDGFDREWVDADTRRVAYYTNMPPGRYRFTVIACNNDGLWNEAGAHMELFLAPHFYETYWFYGACALALALTGAGTQRRRLRRLQTQAQSLSSRVDDALQHIKVLRGLLPICFSCKKIRDDQGYWNQMEIYIRDRSEAEFTHGICPDCAEKLYPGYAEKRARRLAELK